MQREDIHSQEIGSQFRPLPFWSWNDKLETDELIRQIHLMHEAGLGGFFMHARGGLRTPYMGKEWMAAVCTCTREAVKLGMRPYLYDENGFPSGFGDGTVNGMGEDYQQKQLDFKPVQNLSEEDKHHIIAYYDGEYKRVSSADDNGYAAIYSVNPYYVDNLNPAVTDLFIHNIYERYYEELPEDVRDSLAGIFTDEPALCHDGPSWSVILQDAYQQAYGEELLDAIPALFHDIGAFREIRVKFYKLCGKLFRSNYIEKIGSWCEKHHWQLTGHNVSEERSEWHVRSSGAIMPQYTGYSIPGNDHLGRFAAYVRSDVQVVSVACQTGKPQVLTETFGCSGWNFNMQGMQWLYQQQMVHGINLLCQHLQGYSLRGLRKRDYPASFFYQHPMWEHIRPLNDRFARVGRMLASGTVECEVLILHDLSTAWIDCRGNAFSDKMMMANHNFVQLSDDLDRHGIPFHYGDENLIEEMGRVEDRHFHIGRMSYQYVVIPPMDNIGLAAWKLLKRFASEGGSVFNFAGNVEMTVDGAPMDMTDTARLRSFTMYSDSGELIRILDANGVKQLACHVKNDIQGRLRGTWRTFAEHHERWYFIADFGSVPSKKVYDDITHIQYEQAPALTENNVDAEIVLPFAASDVIVVNQETGAEERHPDCLHLADGIHFLCSIPAGGSILLKTVLPAEQPAKNLTSGWNCKYDQNVLTLDKGRYKTPEMPAFSEELDIITIFNRMLLQPDTDVILQYRFVCSDTMDISAASLKIAVELETGNQYYLNGFAVSTEVLGTFIDRSISILQLPGCALRHGENIFEVYTHFHQSPSTRESIAKSRFFESERNKIVFDSEIEVVYLLGNFAVRYSGTAVAEKLNCYFVQSPFVLDNPVSIVSANMLISQGFPCFSGKLTLSRNLELTEDEAQEYTTLNFAPFRADSVQVWLNDHKLPLVYGAPYQVDVTGMLLPGRNSLRLELAVSPRNTLGPFHSASVEPLVVRPGTFLLFDDATNRRAEKTTPAFGLIEPGIASIELR